MKNVILLLCSSILLGSTAFGQRNPEKLEKFKHKFYFQNKTYSAKSIHSILVDDNEAYDIYEHHKQFGSISKVSGYGSLGLIGGGLLLITLSNGDCNDTLCLDYIFGIYSVIGGVVIAPIALITHVVSKIILNKSVRTFNKNNERSKIGSVPMELNLKYSGTGIGLVLSF